MKNLIQFTAGFVLLFGLTACTIYPDNNANNYPYYDGYYNNGYYYAPQAYYGGGGYYGGDGYYYRDDMRYYYDNGIPYYMGKNNRRIYVQQNQEYNRLQGTELSRGNDGFRDGGGRLPSTPNRNQNNNWQNSNNGNRVNSSNNGFRSNNQQNRAQSGATGGFRTPTQERTITPAPSSTPRTETPRTTTSGNNGFRSGR